jgi:ATP-binding cassette subfamily C protein
LRLFAEMVRRDRRRSTLAILCLGLASLAEGVGVATLLPVLTLASQTDRAPEAGGLEASVREVFESLGLELELGALLSVFVAAIVLKAALVLLANRQVGFSVARVATRLRRELTRALIGAEWSFHLRHPVGASASAFSSETDRAAQTYHRGILTLGAAMQVAVYLGLAAWIAPGATLAAIAAGGGVVAILSGLIRAARRAGKRQVRLMRESLIRLTDALFALKPLKAMGREQHIGRVLEGEIVDLNRAIKREVLSKEALKGLQEPLVAIVMAGTVYLAHVYWNYALPTLLALLLLFFRTLSSANKAQREYQAMAARENAYKMVRRTIDRAAASREYNAGHVDPSLERAIEVRDVDLRYGEQHVLEGASLTLPAGEITTLVGMSGAGKTSIADLVLGLVRPDRGEVWIDDHPLSEVALLAWRRSVGYVPQDVSLLHDSVAGNVSLGDPSITRDAVLEALRAAGAADFVEALPEGIDTQVGERGARFSGGQRQRIAVARALARRPKLLILDEATTALDPESEAAICESVASLRGSITILAISHQSPLVELADRVYRVEGGGAKLL